MVNFVLAWIMLIAGGLCGVVCALWLVYKFLSYLGLFR